MFLPFLGFRNPMSKRGEDTSSRLLRDLPDTIDCLQASGTHCFGGEGVFQRSLSSTNLPTGNFPTLPAFSSPTALVRNYSRQKEVSMLPDYQGNSSFLVIDSTPDAAERCDSACLFRT